MRLLLDTHILLWVLTDEERLSEKARKLVENAENDLYYSILSLWEIELKHLTHPACMDFSAEQIAGFCHDSGFYPLSIREEHIIFYLPRLKRAESAPPHKDPFDKLLICQAAVENMLFLTHDRLLSAYDEPCVLLV